MKQNNVINLPDYLADREREFEAMIMQIIEKIDPQAGGFFRRRMERATREGMEFGIDATEKALKTAQDS